MKFKMWKIMVAMQDKFNIYSQAWHYAMDWLVDTFSEEETALYFQTLEDWSHS